MNRKNIFVILVVSVFVVFIIFFKLESHINYGVDAKVIDKNIEESEVNNQETNVLTEEIIRPEGYDKMDIYDKYVIDTVDSPEYKEIYNKRFKRFGSHVAIQLIPKNETLRGFEEKIDESLKAGYDLLPIYYNWKEAYLWTATKRFEELNKRYKKSLNKKIPLMQIGGVSMDKLEELVDNSIEQGKDLLPEFFNCSNDPDIHY